MEWHEKNSSKAPSTFAVYQDLRSRSMSDGDPEFENLKPVYSLTNTARTETRCNTFEASNVRS